MADELRLSPGWNMPFQSTVITQLKEQPPNKIVQIVRGIIQPPSPQRRRTRSESGTKEPTTNTEQTETSYENSNKKQPKNSTGERQVNKGKAYQNSTTKGEKTKTEATETNNQQKQNYKENTTRTSRNRRNQLKEKTPKQNSEKKPKKTTKKTKTQRIRK